MEARAMKNPVEPTPKSIASGKIVYDKYCAECHGLTGRAGQVRHVERLIHRINSARLKTATGHVQQPEETSFCRLHHLRRDSDLDAEQRPIEESTKFRVTSFGLT